MTTPTDGLNAALAGRYQIERRLGEGGMATVYLARDLRHDRNVAVKVLKPELALVLGAERFLLEIKTTAALQHPHILPLFDSGSAGGFLFYVMPWIDGETLRDKITRETQLRVDESVRIAREVADALDYAHRHGVIHRDIKPENILLHDGRPIVADFGIALAVSAAAGGRMTESGLSLGTPHYMSPEQATAQKEIDARSDIYSLGSVLYEMLSGRPPHTGASAQQVIMKIITEPADPITRHRKSVPDNVAAAVAKAIEKVPADRFESASAFASALGNPGYTSAERAGERGFITRQVGPRSVAAGVVGAALTLLAIAGWGWVWPPPSAPVLRYQLQLPPGMSNDLDAPAPVPSPDGSFLVLRGSTRDGQGTQLWIKWRDRTSAVPLAGTDGAQRSAVSPDGAWIAFVADGMLKKVQVAGGVPVTLVGSDIDGSLGVAWTDDDQLVFSTVKGGVPALQQVSANGGAVAVVYRTDSAGAALPAAIPGAHSILFARCTALIESACGLWTADLRTGKRHLVLAGVRSGRYATTGHLVYVQNGRLYASRFDRNALAVTGQPIPLADSIAPSPFPIELSRSGMLLTRVGGSSAPLTFEMVWVDRAGHQTPIDTTWSFQVSSFAGDHGWSLSPEGTRLAIGLFTDAGDDIWVKQLPRGPLSRVTYDTNPDVRPHWTADGNRVIFFSLRRPAGIYRHRADGVGKDSLLLAGDINEAAISRDGEWLVFRDGAVGAVRGNRDIRGKRLSGDTTRVSIVVTPFDEEAIALSPNGRWIAYQSDEGGKTDVYIRSFPNTDTYKAHVSTGGGAAPLWSRDGRELFYLGADKNMMAVQISGGPSITVGDPVALFHVPDDLLAVEYAYYTPWDITADGRFIMARLRHSGARPTSIVVVAENWLTELAARFRR